MLQMSTIVVVGNGKSKNENQNLNPMPTPTNTKQIHSTNGSYRGDKFTNTREEGKKLPVSPMMMYLKR